MLMKLLEVRTFLLKVYQKARFIINPLIKFVLSMFVFRWINSSIGYDPRFTGNTVVLLLSVICAVTPGGVLVFFAMVLTLLHVYSVSVFLAILLLVMFIILYGMLMRFAPKQALAAVAIPVLAKYNLHYFVPIFLGCTANPLSILPVACGAVIYNMMEIIKAAATRQVNLRDLDSIIGLFKDVVDAFLANKQMLITIGVFAAVIIVVYIIRKFSFDYAFAISVGAGVLVNILGFLVADLKYDVSVSVGTLIGKSIICGLLAVLFELMKRILDYSAIERVQFEDDDYYYYVKAVPKVNVSIPRHNVKHMSDYEDEENESESETDEYAAAYGDIALTSADDEVRYEDFDDDDFSEEEYHQDNFDYDDDEDLSQYGMKSIGPADEGEDEGYEEEMTLDDNEDI